MPSPWSRALLPAITDELSLQVYYPNASSAPTSHVWSASDRYATCDYCGLFFQGCDGGSCSGNYFAQAGTLQLNTATQNFTSGTISGTMTNVRFVEWDFSGGVDAPVDGGRCIILQTKPFNASWP